MELLSLEFINTQWYTKNESYEEYLYDSEWLYQFTKKWEIPQFRIDKEFANKLINLRSFLFTLLTKIVNKDDISLGEIKKLNSYLSIINVEYVLSSNCDCYELKKTYKGSKKDIFVYLIIYSFSEMISSEVLTQLKICENPECDWIFYDDSKNHTRKWCSNTCASLIKVRRFREKNR